VSVEPDKLRVELQRDAENPLEFAVAMVKTEPERVEFVLAVGSEADAIGRAIERLRSAIDSLKNLPPTFDPSCDYKGKMMWVNAPNQKGT